ncbi:hypothetical protein RhiirB3_485300 [Rhizophagus irregularis]|nr:hypothetical protein RhiirB3_485300 [Rhizophagus irregularis]
MQYANGGDLQDYLKNNFKNFTWNDKKKLAFQIADGLNYLHNENVLHRDLVVIPDTPKEYEKLYKNCWNQEPEQRPTIKEVLDEFEGMGFGINVVNKLIKDITSDLTSELQTMQTASSESLEYAQSSSLHIYNQKTETVMDPER